MELFKFAPDSSLYLADGEAINGMDSIVWTERYREAGEIKISAKLSSGLREVLPIGSLVSHTATREVMIIENHQIKDDGKETPILEISGRTLETFLENRIVGSDQPFPITPITKYSLASANSGTQAKTLIQDHITSTYYSADNLPGIVVDALATGSVAEARDVSRGEVYKSLLEILAIEELGIRVERPSTDQYTRFYIYDGANKTSSVVFSWQVGDLDNTEYLWSSKNYKNQAIVTGKWVEVRYFGAGDLYYNARVMYIDGKDIDDVWETAPTLGDLTAVQNAMTTRAKQMLANQRFVQIAKTDVSATARFKFREDYNVGDLVRVDGNYGAIETMRVIEHVEIQDESGSSSYPTLAIVQT